MSEWKPLLCWHKNTLPMHRLVKTSKQDVLDRGSYLNTVFAMCPLPTNRCIDRDCCTLTRFKKLTKSQLEFRNVTLKSLFPNCSSVVLKPCNHTVLLSHFIQLAKYPAVNLSGAIWGAAYTNFISTWPGQHLLLIRVFLLTTHGFFLQLVTAR